MRATEKQRDKIFQLLDYENANLLLSTLPEDEIKRLLLALPINQQTFVISNSSGNKIALFMLLPVDQQIPVFDDLSRDTKNLILNALSDPDVISIFMDRINVYDMAFFLRFKNIDKDNQWFLRVPENRRPKVFAAMVNGDNPPQISALYKLISVQHRAEFFEKISHAHGYIFKSLDSPDRVNALLNGELNIVSCINLMDIHEKLEFFKSATPKQSVAAFTYLHNKTAMLLKFIHEERFDCLLKLVDYRDIQPFLIALDLETQKKISQCASESERNYLFGIDGYFTYLNQAAIFSSLVHHERVDFLLDLNLDAMVVLLSHCSSKQEQKEFIELAEPELLGMIFRCLTQVNTEMPAIQALATLLPIDKVREIVLTIESKTTQHDLLLSLPDNYRQSICDSFSEEVRLSILGARDNDKFKSLKAVDLEYATVKQRCFILETLVNQHTPMPTIQALTTLLSNEEKVEILINIDDIATQGEFLQVFSLETRSAMFKSLSPVRQGDIVQNFPVNSSFSVFNIDSLVQSLSVTEQLNIVSCASNFETRVGVMMGCMLEGQRSAVFKSLDTSIQLGILHNLDAMKLTPELMRLPSVLTERERYELFYELYQAGDTALLFKLVPEEQHADILSKLDAWNYSSHLLEFPQELKDEPLSQAEKARNVLSEIKKVHQFKRVLGQIRPDATLAEIGKKMQMNTEIKTHKQSIPIFDRPPAIYAR